MSLTTVGTSQTPRSGGGPSGDRGGPKRVSGGLLDPAQLLKSPRTRCASSTRGCSCGNPVMFVVEVGSALTTVSAIVNPSVFSWAITIWLWLTCVFANLAEAVAEGRGKAQAETLRRTKRETMARKLNGWRPGQPAGDSTEEAVSGSAFDHR